MALLHTVYDTDAHFEVNPITRAIKNSSTGKNVLIQGDHNSERFTFELPRLIDGHDMSQSTAVQVHYINIDSTDKTQISADVYEVDDLQISPDSEDVVICSWLISRNATKYAGSLAFLLKFQCIDAEGSVTYEWNTAPFTSISVSSGIDNSGVIEEDYSDILAQWEARLVALEKGIEGLRVTITDGFASHSSTEITDYFHNSGTVFIQNENGRWYPLQEVNPGSVIFGCANAEDGIIRQFEVFQDRAVVESVFTLAEYETCEAKANKTTVIDENSTDAQYPSAKAVGDALKNDRNPDRHTKFFEISSDGVIALKPEYRGTSTQSALTYSISDNGVGVAGSKNAELPKYLVIPEIVDGVAVHSLVDGMFCENAAVVEVELPYTVKAIPVYCFYNCYSLTEIYNTEGITTIGDRCLQNCSSLKRVKFANLETTGLLSLSGCPRLIYADIGNATKVTDRLFAFDISLQRVKNKGKVTEVDRSAFFKNTDLKYFDNIDKLTKIGKGAFVGPEIDFSEISLKNCDVSAGNTTHLQFNPNNIGKGVGSEYSACENPIPTYFAQTNPALEDKPIGTSGKTYDNGCVLFSFIHAYCGLKNMLFSSIDEMESHFTAIDPDFFNNFTNDDNGLQAMCQAAGVNDDYYASYGETSVQAIYEAVSNGSYVVVVVGNGSGNLTGHTVVIYGIDNRGKLLAVDSSSRYYNDFGKPFSYSFYFDKYISPTTSYHILSLQEA